MDAIAQTNNLKQLVNEGTAGISKFLFEMVRLQSESRLNEIFEGAIRLSNNQPQEKYLKQKILHYINRRRNNQYWLYLYHQLKARNPDVLTYDQYIRQLISQDILKSRPKSILDKVTQFFTLHPPNLNYGNFTPFQRELKKAKQNFYMTNLPSSTRAKIEAWMHYSQQQQIQNLMNESSSYEGQKSSNELHDTFVQTEESSLHID